MNRLAKFTAGIVLAMSFTLTACGGGDDPKSLAKQSWEIQKEAMNLKHNDPKLAELNKKKAALQEKLKLLSEEDQKIAIEENMRLMKEGK
jgi:hypothetical protein